MNKNNQNSIWACSLKAGKTSYWIPYLKNISRLKKTKPSFLIEFNGGEINVDLTKTEFMLFYGASGELTLDFLDQLSVHSIPLIIHRRNLNSNLYFYRKTTASKNDLLTKQILYRSSVLKSAVISKSLIHGRLDSMKWLISINENDFKRLRALRSSKEVMNFEAVFAKRYWKAYFLSLGFKELNRRGNNPISKALDAGSFFLSGIVLRWTLFHNLSPAHGYLHTQTEIPSLVYDLMEPYRYLIEIAVHESVLELISRKQLEQDILISTALNKLKKILTTDIYVPKLRINLARKNLLHGGVLALRGYLLGNDKLPIFPLEGLKVKGGRKHKVSYKIPGAKAP